MTKETLLDYINEVDEDLIESVPVKETSQESAKKNKIIKYVAVAASLLVVVGVTLITTKINEKQETKVAENTTENTINVASKADGLEFMYNNSNYAIVEDEAYLTSNSLPVSVGESQLGDCLQNNVGDLQNNVILGDIYECKGNDESVLIVKMWDGTYEVAVQLDEENEE